MNRSNNELHELVGQIKGYLVHSRMAPSQASESISNALLSLHVLEEMIFEGKLTTEVK